MKIGLVQQHASRSREDNIARGLEALEEACFRERSFQRKNIRNSLKKSKGS